MDLHAAGTDPQPERPRGRLATYQDVLDAPEGKSAELIAGELVLSPRPARRHTRVASVLGSLLLPPFDLGIGGPGGWLILDEPELHLDDDILVPDLAGWRIGRAEKIDDSAFFLVPPDWVCEVLSPSTAALDRTDKMEVYARSLVKHLWLIDPALQTLEVYAWSERGWVMVKTWRRPEKVRAVPFDEIELNLSALWPPTEVPRTPTP